LYPIHKTLESMKNKIRNILLLALIAGYSINLNAQKIRFGVFADPQLSWFTSDTKQFSPNGPLFGFNAGFAFERFFADRYAISSGASITNLGGNLLYNEDGYSIETRDDEYPILAGSSVKFKGQYISVPLGFKFKTNEIGYTTFYAQLGLAGHLRLKGYAWQEENNVDREVLENDQIYLGFVSYMFGAGLEYSLGGPSALQAGLTFSNSMTPTFDAGYGRIGIGSLALRIGLVF
jgi:hypothetical protein